MPEINERVGKLEAHVEDIRHFLFGNGDIGEIAKMKDLIRGQADMIQRLNLETKLDIADIKKDITKYLGWFGGALAAILFLTGNGTITLESVIHLFFGHK